MNLELARSVADAVLYEGYLLYPYRASSSKNQARWQFGVLGPPGAAAAGIGEDSSMSMQCLLGPPDSLAPRAESVEGPSLVVHLRFLQLQRRQLYDADGERVEQVIVDGISWLSWDEAVEREVVVPLRLDDLASGISTPVAVAGNEVAEPLNASTGACAGTLKRHQWALGGQLTARTEQRHGYTRLTLAVANTSDAAPASAAEAIRTSFIGTHLLVEAHGVPFVSLLEPPDEARLAVEECAQHRCWPVLTGKARDTDLVLGSPIILYDYPEIASESTGALFDATEIDEILTLRVMTMTEEEKAEARATDPRAREIIDRCDQMSPAALQQLHGVLRNPYAGPTLLSAETEPRWSHASDLREIDPPSFDTGDVPWWDPAADAAVRPERDAVTINGVSVAKGSLVCVHPGRRADAQDIFFAGQLARVSAVLSDVDGDVHVAVVLVDDPAADLHEWYGRYFYFSPDEIEPLVDSIPGAAPSSKAAVHYREETRP